MSEPDPRDTSFVSTAQLAATPLWQKVLRHPATWPTVTFLTSFGLLAWIRPGFVLKCKENNLEKAQINWLSVTLWALVAALIVLTVPFLISAVRGG